MPSQENRIKLSTYFGLHEFHCRCCHTVMMHSKAFWFLRKLRAKLETRIDVFSGYRCPAHNKEEGGHAQSGHMSGRCYDIFAHGVMPEVVQLEAERIGFDRCYVIGKGPSVHVGISRRLAQNA